ncbi:MAG: hypothetical protein AAF721_15450 [Myxococcota bacterium]
MRGPKRTLAQILLTPWTVGRRGIGCLCLGASLALACGGDDGRRGGAWLTAGGVSMSDTGGDGAGGDDLDDDGDGAASLDAADDDQGDDRGDDDGTGADDRGEDDAADVGESDDGNDDGTGDPPAGRECPENCYCEPYDPDANVDDLVAAYSAANWEQTVFDFLDRRWPAGSQLLQDQQNDSYFGSFSNKSDFGMAFGDGLPTEAHEMTHGWDFGHATVSEFAYFVRGDLQFMVDKQEGFPRSQIYGLVSGNSTAQYADLYLTGTQGTYGFNDILDEGNCYIHDMATYGVTPEFMPWAGISGRDGAVAFMYFLELYLGVARTQYPQFYAEIKADPEYVELVQTQWLRMHFFLPFLDEHPELGINDAAIRDLMYQADNQGEIEMFIDHELEASNCLP